MPRVGAAVPEITPANYLDLGWRVLPIEPGTKIPLTKKGEKGRYGLKHATADYEQVMRWGSEQCDWAIACLASGITVLDDDPRNGGAETWEELVARLGPLPPHPIQATRNGGLHHIFADSGIDLAGIMGPGVDIKRNGYILVAPSSGYSWKHPPNGSLPQLPAAWLEAAKKGNGRPENAAKYSPPHDPSERPGDDYSARGDHRRVLEDFGWKFVHQLGANEAWRRPGKDEGTSGTWHTEKRIFYCFTSSTDLEIDKGYTLFQLRAILEKIDYHDLAKVLASEGYGEQRKPTRGYEQVPPPDDDDAPPDLYLVDDAPLPDDDEAPPEIEEEVQARKEAVCKLPAGLPPREDVAKWAGYIAQTAQKAADVRPYVCDGLMDAYCSGISVAVGGGRINKPSDICETDARRYKRMLAGEPERKARGPVNLPVAITRLVRRPVSNRASFDMTISDGERSVTLTRLDGAAIGSYAHVRNLTLEHCISLPANVKPTRDAWDDLLAEAFTRVEEADVDVEESTLLAVRQEIVTILLDSEVCEEEMDLRRGMVAQDEDGKVLYAWPRSLMSKIRARMDADKPTREQIIDAAKLLDFKESRPTLTDGKRPRVWSFEIAVLQKIFQS